MIRVGIAALARADAFARAEASLARFVADTGWTAMLTLWGAGGPVCVRWLTGRPPVMASFGVGAVLPLDCAAGHVFLALLPEVETAAARATGGGPAELARVQAEVRATLTARQNATIGLGLRAIAAPVLDLQGRPVLVATALAADSRPRTADDAIAEQMRQAGRRATLDSGGVWPAQASFTPPGAV